MVHQRKTKYAVKAICRSLAAGIILATTAFAPMAETSDTAFEDRVRAYLLANPEVILEALEILSERETRSELAAKIARHTDLFTQTPVLGIGPKGAETTVLEFFDYRCAPCKALHPKLVKALEAHPEIRVEMRHLPILSPGSERGARFALAVKKIATPDAYVAVHQDLWALKGPLRGSAFKRIAADHNLDWDAVEAEMNSEEVSARIAQNRDLAIDLEIVGTPAFVTPSSVSIGSSNAAALVSEWLSQ